MEDLSDNKVVLDNGEFINSNSKTPQSSTDVNPSPLEEQDTESIKEKEAIQRKIDTAYQRKPEYTAARTFQLQDLIGRSVGDIVHEFTRGVNGLPSLHDMILFNLRNKGTNDLRIWGWAGDEKRKNSVMISFAFFREFKRRLGIKHDEEAVIGYFQILSNAM
jgi:hypothetical protein